MSLQFWINLGWLGLIIVHLLTPFVCFLPIAYLLRMGVTGAMATLHPWWLVAIVANACGTISMIGLYYIFRLTCSWRLYKKIAGSRLVTRLSATLNHRMFGAIIILAISPLPEILIPMMASAKRYSIWKYSAAIFIGRLIHTLPMVLGGIGLKILWLWIQQISLH